MDLEWPVGAAASLLGPGSVPWVYCTCPRARNDPFPREALLFYEGVKEARALPSPGRVSNRPYLRYTKPFGAFISRSLVFTKREDSRPCMARPLCQLVTWAPCRREKNERRGAPLSGSRLVLSHPGTPRDSPSRNIPFSRRLTSPP